MSCRAGGTDRGRGAPDAGPRGDPDPGSDERPTFDEIARGIERDAPRPAGIARRLWTWLTTCAVEGCSRRPTRLGWCDAHAPADDPGPDEYWGDPDGASR